MINFVRGRERRDRERHELAARERATLEALEALNGRLEAAVSALGEQAQTLALLHEPLTILAEQLGLLRERFDILDGRANAVEEYLVTLVDRYPELSAAYPKRRHPDAPFGGPRR